MLISRTMRKSTQLNGETRQSMKAKFTKNLDTIIDSCNEIMIGNSLAGGNLFAIS